MRMFKNNRFILSVILGLIIVLGLPHLIRFASLGPKYTTLIINGPSANQISWEETYTYATEANRIKNSQPLNDPYLFEYRLKRSPLTSETIPSILLGLPAKIFSIPLVFILAKIFFVPFTILFWYLIAREFGYSKLASVSASMTSIVLQKLFVYLPYLSKLYDYETNGYLESQRLYFPLVSSLIVSVTIFFIIRNIKSSKIYKYKILAGVSLGFLFFTYFFSWVLIWAAFFLFLLTLFIFKNTDTLKKLITPALIGLAISVPYFFNNISFYKNPVSHDFLARTISFPITDWNIPIIFRFAILLGLLLIFNKDWVKNRTNRFLICVYVVATLLPLVSMIVLGMDNQTDHWYERFLYPLSTFIFVLFIADLKHIWGKVKQVTFVALILVSLIKLDFSVSSELDKPIEDFSITEPRRQLYGWMSQNIKKDSVIASLSFTEQVYLTAYTPFYSYLPQAYKTIAPTEELIKRYADVIRIYGANENLIKQSFIMPNEQYANSSSIVANDGNAFQMLLGIATHFDYYPYPQHKSIQDKVILLSSQKSPPQGRIDYLLFGPLEKENAINFELKKCKLLFNNGVYKLYNYETCQI